MYELLVRKVFSFHFNINNKNLITHVKHFILKNKEKKIRFYVLLDWNFLNTHVVSYGL